MQELKANISGIIKSSMIDGPGNRMVIFFQSCQFNCMYCHNPYTINLCKLCGNCIEACPTQSLLLNRKEKHVIHNSSTCIKCDQCIRNCPHGSSPFYQKYSVEELLNEIMEVSDFISGLTVSGGEVMLQAPFLKLLFESIRQHKELKHLSLFIDSNGAFAPKKWESLLPLTDAFMIDIKAVFPESHKQITEQNNQLVLESIQFLNQQRKLYEVRTVIVPGYNDSKEEIAALAEIYKSLPPDVNKVLIKLRKHGIRKKYSYLESPTDQHMQKVWEQIGDPRVKIL